MEADAASRFAARREARRQVPRADQVLRSLAAVVQAAQQAAAGSKSAAESEGENTAPIVNLLLRPEMAKSAQPEKPIAVPAEAHKLASMQAENPSAVAEPAEKPALSCVPAEKTRIVSSPEASAKECELLRPVATHVATPAHKLKPATRPWAAEPFMDIPPTALLDATPSKDRRRLGLAIQVSGTSTGVISFLRSVF